MPNSRSSSVQENRGTLNSTREPFPVSRRNHEDKSSISLCGRRLTACGYRLSTGKEDQAVGPSACRRKDSRSGECRCNHSRIFDRKRKGPNFLRSSNDRKATYQAYLDSRRPKRGG